MSCPRISVIIPVYNTEEYVAQAVESIISQTLTDIEIIIINDGSTDNSLSILEKIAQEDTRIQLYSQNNQGQSVARNMGINHATGKYLYFMDSDDLLEADALAFCLEKCEAHHLDFVFFDASVLRSNSGPYISLNYNRMEVTDEDEIYSGYALLNVMLNHRVYSASPCLNCIRKSYLERISLAFYPGIIHEDELFTFKLYLYAHRIMGIHRTFFIRRVRQNSTMTQAFAWKNMCGYLTVAKEIDQLRKTTTDDKERKAIDLFLPQMLNAAVWRAHVLTLPDRLYLLKICIAKYKRYVTTKTLMILLFKVYTR